MVAQPPRPPAGIITLNKPVGITSAKALYRVRALTRVRKSGHAGTLDPAADGVLVLCLGQATKLVESIMDQPKVYRAAARLDVTSTSFDSEAPLQPVETARRPTPEEVRAALAGFEGRILQVPPAVSALKVGGRPAYELARRDQAPDLPPRPVTIYWVHLHAYAWPMLDFEMCCGRGTYVRAVARDLGQRLGTGGCLTALTRSAVGPFTLDRAVSFDALQTSGDPLSAMMPFEQAKALLDVRPISVPCRP
jgi:tRNA pseudouridine55 synthase